MTQGICASLWDIWKKETEEEKERASAGFCDMVDQAKTNPIYREILIRSNPFLARLFDRDE